MSAARFILLVSLVLSFPSPAEDRLASPHPRLNEIATREIGRFDGRPISLSQICDDNYHLREAVTNAMYTKVSKVPLDADAFDFLHAAAIITRGTITPEVEAAPGIKAMMQSRSLAECVRRASDVLRRARACFSGHDWASLVCETKNQILANPHIDPMKAIGVKLAPSLIRLRESWARAHRALPVSEVQKDKLEKAGVLRRRVFADSASEFLTALKLADLTIVPEDPRSPLAIGEYRVRSGEKNYRIVFLEGGVSIRPEERTSLTPTTISPLLRQRFGITDIPSLDVTPSVEVGLDVDKQTGATRSYVMVARSTELEGGGHRTHSIAVPDSFSKRVLEYLERRFSQIGFSSEEVALASALSTEFRAEISPRDLDMNLIAERLTRLPALPPALRAALAERETQKRNRLIGDYLESFKRAWQTREAEMESLMDRLHAAAEQKCGLINPVEYGPMLVPPVNPRAPQAVPPGNAFSIGNARRGDTH